MGTHVFAHRKPLVFGVSVIGAVLVMSSVAFACVQTRGKLIVTGQNGFTSSNVGNGHHTVPGPSNSAFCKPSANMKAGAGSFARTPTSAAGTFQVQLALPPTNCPFLQKTNLTPWIPNATTPNIFPDGNYDVMFCQSQTGQGVFTTAPLTFMNDNETCFFWADVTDTGTLVGTIKVSGGHSGNKTFNVPVDAMPTPAGTYAGVSVRETSNCKCGPPPVNVAPIAMI